MFTKGMRVRRHRIVKNDLAECYNWRDLNLRQNLPIYGTVYRLCDCDQFTRVYRRVSPVVNLTTPF